MLDGTAYFECTCGASEHTLRFTYSEGDGMFPSTLYTEIYLHNYKRFWKRLWYGIKYIFGYKCKYGAWDVWELRAEDVPRLKVLLTKLEGK